MSDCSRQLAFLFSTQSFEDLIEELFRGFLLNKAHVINVFQKAAEP